MPTCATPLALCAFVAIVALGCSSDDTETTRKEIDGVEASKSCPAVPDVAPLDDGCREDVCHVAIRLDYETLAWRGFASAGGPRSPVDGSGAVDAAQPIFASNDQYLSLPGKAQTTEAGVTRVLISPSDFGAFALVGTNSGVLITAGGVTFAGRGRYWAPSWNPPDAIACGANSAEPTSTFFDGESCAFADPNPPYPKPQAALDVALRTNLAAHYAERGPFSAFVYLYTPMVGGCDPAVAEYIVVLSTD